MHTQAGYTPDADVTLYEGDCLDFLKQLPVESVQLVVTSPPYNIGKRYEKKRSIDRYLSEQQAVINRCVDLLRPGGSICWQVGNHIAGPQEIVPLDIALYPLFASRGLKLRNRIIWHFEHGLHCSRRFSGRYETVLWFTKEIRIPSTSTRFECLKSTPARSTSADPGSASCPAIP